jgi:hypothetical protein
LAFATRTASCLADVFCFGGDAFVSFPPIGVGALEARPTGCVLIGPVTGRPLAMRDNWILPNLFHSGFDETIFLASRNRPEMDESYFAGRALKRI